MPRVENLGYNVNKFCRESGEGSSLYDVCQLCYTMLMARPTRFNNILSPYNGDPQGEDGWGGDVEHPPYDDEEGDHTCEICHVVLTDKEDGNADESIT